MKSLGTLCAWRRHILCCASIPCLSLLASASSPSDPVLRIEEDWTLVLNEPNEDRLSPQFHTVMSPRGDTDSFFGQVLWNYRETYDVQDGTTFAAGGLQLQGWNGLSMTARKSVGSSQLSVYAETIRWTQVLETDGSTLTFGIDNGQSVTWGTFGREMRITSSAAVSDLNSYSTSTSVDNSWITYGANRVERMVITEVRRYGPNGMISRDTTQRVVYERED
ncbi:MAG: hypothetical protein CHACPFDD_01362 [Phycisphaerae bacterium]|nr:hypothetical protein [Phycisphaerae bacterium]